MTGVTPAFYAGVLVVIDGVARAAGEGPEREFVTLMDLALLDMRRVPKARLFPDEIRVVGYQPTNRELLFDEREGYAVVHDEAVVRVDDELGWRQFVVRVALRSEGLATDTRCAADHEQRR